MKLLANSIAPRHLVTAVAMLVLGILLMSGGQPSSANLQESRQRRTYQAPVSPTPAQTPAPARTTTSTGQTPTPSPRHGAPTLGDAPPPPRLRQKPTPVPTPEEIDPDSKITINSQLVNLQIRVIDRSNRPIDNVTKDSFHVFEDGVQQPVENVTKEEVGSPTAAVDTPVATQPDQAVIDAAKTIINSSQKGDGLSSKSSSVVTRSSRWPLLPPTRCAARCGTIYLEGGQTAVIDGVYLAAKAFRNTRRR